MEKFVLINFDDGIPTEETQLRLKLLLNRLTEEELDKVEDILYNKLHKIEKQNNIKYEVEFVSNIPLQIELHKDDLKKPFQYGVHGEIGDRHFIKVLKMSDVDPIKGRLGQLVILAHEIGHAILGEKNYELKDRYNLWLMEKSTDESIKSYLYNYKYIIPNFYEIYYLCRNTHHYKTKEGDFKEFFKDIISVLEKEWENYKNEINSIF